MKANFRMALRAARLNAQGITFAFHLIGKSDKWCICGEHGHPGQIGHYHTLSDKATPELTYWDGNQWEYMDGHTDTIAMWYDKRIEPSLDGRSV